jgi:hypothetical protein
MKNLTPRERQDTSLVLLTSAEQMLARLVGGTGVSPVGSAEDRRDAGPTRSISSAGVSRSTVNWATR